MFTSEDKHKPRPYWHVDFKWISGISLFFLTSIALLLFTISALTERQPAIKISATIIASLASKDGLDDPSTLATLRKTIQSLPGDVVAPFPQFPTIKLQKQQVLTLDPVDLRVAIYSQVTTILYDKGLDEALSTITADATTQQQLGQQAFVLQLFTKQAHETVARTALWITALALLPLAEIIYFSNRWGRLVSPGIVALQASSIGAVAGFFGDTLQRSGYLPASIIPSSILTILSSSLLKVYGPVFVIGACLLIVAGLGKLTTYVLYVVRTHRDDQ